MPDRIGVFVDGPNLYGGTRDLMGDGRLNIPRFSEYLRSGRQLEEFVYWQGQLKQEVDAKKYANQQRFFAEIENGIENARIGRATLHWRSGRWVEKGVDVGVALDAICGAYENRWDVAVIVSGDGDLAGIGRILHGMGKRLEVVCCAGRLSGMLADEADTVRELNAKILKHYG